VIIGIGADHRGYDIKEYLKTILRDKGHTVQDFGTDSDDSCDYPDIACPLAEAQARGEIDRGILICGSGIGMSIAANKIKGAYAALCMNEEMAKMSRNHNNANILTFGASILDRETITRIVEVYLSEEFEAGRHKRRFNKIVECEK
jgi:RpiB/LacA/LacB family sugar-phosphate isomerase